MSVNPGPRANLSGFLLVLVDAAIFILNNVAMGAEKLPVDPTLADLEAVCKALSEHGGRPVLDPELEKRVLERGERAREENTRLFGISDDSVRVVREIRDGE